MIYVSTGHFKNYRAKEAIKLFAQNKIKNIELSGGLFQKDINTFLPKLKNIYNFQIHNYFPPPKFAKVINLASGQKKIIEDSIMLIKKAIDLCKKIDAKYYSFHAGFLADLTPKDLGKSKKKLKEIPKFVGLENFLKNVEIISNYASKKNVQILLENNVIGRYNFKLFKKNPFLMTDLEDINLIMNNTPKNVNLLLDLGHLKVSSNTQNFDKHKVHEESKQWIKAYHLSENDGSEDTNLAIKKNSWFGKTLKKVDSYTLEVYTKNFDTLKDQQKLLRKLLKKTY